MSPSRAVHVYLSLKYAHVRMHFPIPHTLAYYAAGALVFVFRFGTEAAMNGRWTSTAVVNLIGSGPRRWLAEIELFVENEITTVHHDMLRDKWR